MKPYDYNFREEKRITVDFDIVVAVLGAIAGLQLTLWLAISTAQHLYPIFAFFSFVGCLTYLTVKIRLRSLSISDLFKERSNNLINILLLNILFFTLLSIALLSIAFRHEIYSRPTIFYICISLASAVLALEILFLPAIKGYTYYLLLKVIFIVLILVLTPQIIFPSVLGFDPFAHSVWTQDTLDSKHIELGEYYSSFPGMHLTIGSTMLLTNLNYKIAAMLSACTLYVIITLLFVFLIARFIFSPKVGLMAALLLGCSAFYIGWGWGMVPNSWSLVFLTPLAYIFFMVREQRSLRLLALSILLMGVLIITHTIGALCVAIFLLLTWLGQRFYQWTFKEEFKLTADFYLCMLFVVGLFSWWIYTSPFVMSNLHNLIDYRLTIGSETEPIEASSQYLASISLVESIGRNVANSSLWAISFIGCLAAFSLKFGNRFSFVLSLTGLLFLIIGFVSMPLQLAIIPGRWQLASVFLLCIPAGYALLLFLTAFKGNLYKILLFPALIMFLTFLSITSPTANIDNAVLAKNTMVRDAFIESEQQAMETIVDHWQGEVASDAYYGNIYTGAYYENIYIGYNEMYVLTDDFINKDFTDLEGVMVIIREEVAEKPFQAPGVLKLNYDPREVILGEGFSQLYDCGTVAAFIRN